MVRNEEGHCDFRVQVSSMPAIESQTSTTYGRVTTITCGRIEVGECDYGLRYVFAEIAKGA